MCGTPTDPLMRICAASSAGSSRFLHGEIVQGVVADCRVLASGGAGRPRGILPLRGERQVLSIAQVAASVANDLERLSIE